LDHSVTRGTHLPAGTVKASNSELITRNVGRPEEQEGLNGHIATERWNAQSEYGPDQREGHDAPETARPTAELSSFGLHALISKASTKGRFVLMFSVDEMGLLFSGFVFSDHQLFLRSRT
jgi:hypothetical protein